MYRNSKHTIIFPLFLAAGVIAGLLFGHYIGRNTTTTKFMGMLRTIEPRMNNKLTQVMGLIQTHYVDEVSLDTLSERVLPHLFKELDPHSVYIPAKDLAAVNESLEGEFDGIGVVFNMTTDTVVVLNVIHQGPSDKAGIRAGDRIVAVNDSIIAGRKKHMNDVVKLLRGPRGSKVKLGIARRGIAEMIPHEVVRDAIPIKSIESSFEIVDGIGYVKLGQFARTSFAELSQSLTEFRQKGIHRLIFDLRGNAGGFLDQAIRIANEFLHADQLIVYTEDRAKRRMNEYANGAGSAQDMEVAVLIDEGSASSSEILAGALQDNDRGTIIGRRSFGKGLVQQQIPFTDGSAIRLTTARYYTPTGRSIQKPYTPGDDEAYDEDLWKRYKNNEFFSADSIHFADSLKRVTPKGKVVYGGGGIMPDIFVPADTTDVTKYFMQVTGRSILYRYTLEYSDAHREELSAIKSTQELHAYFAGKKNLVEDFVAYAARHGVRPVRRDIARSRKLIEAQLRSYIGRNTPLEDNGFYANIYPIDVVILRAIDELNKTQAHD